MILFFNLKWHIGVMYVNIIIVIILVSPDIKKFIWAKNLTSVLHVNIKPLLKIGFYAI
jgi:hypothetical protein